MTDKITEAELEADGVEDVETALGQALSGFTNPAPDDDPTDDGEALDEPDAPTGEALAPEAPVEANTTPAAAGQQIVVDGETYTVRIGRGKGRVVTEEGPEFLLEEYQVVAD